MDSSTNVVEFIDFILNISIEVKPYPHPKLYKITFSKILFSIIIHKNINFWSNAIRL